MCVVCRAWDLLRLLSGYQITWLWDPALSVCLTTGNKLMAERSALKLRTSREMGTQVPGPRASPPGPSSVTKWGYLNDLSEQLRNLIQGSARPGQAGTLAIPGPRC